MHTIELLQWLRYDAYIGDAAEYPDQTDLVLLDEMTHKLHSVFGDIIVKARAGYWLQTAMRTTVVGQRKYPIPDRAVAGGLESVEIAATATGALYTLGEIAPTDVQEWEGPLGAPTQGDVEVFCVEGPNVELYLLPRTALPLRLNYYIRPSKLVLPQLGLPSGDPDRGRVTDKTATTITVNAVPFDRNTAAAITSGSVPIDVVHPAGWHELALVGATQTLAGSVFTITDGQSTDEVQIGDYVRAQDQSEWPCLPADFHRAVADVAAVKVAVELGLREKNDALAQNVENDLVRFRSLLAPRVKSEPKMTPVFLWTRGGG